MRGYAASARSGTAWRRASCKPRPMTWRARASEGGATPTSRQAAMMACTIAPAESMRVPSQSNTTRSNCLAIVPLLIHFQIGEVVRQFLSQGRLQGDLPVSQGMAEAQARGMEEHAPQALPFQFLVAGEVAVLVVATQGEALVGEMHPNLMGAAGLEFHLHQAGGLPAPHQSHDAVGGLALPADAHPPLPLGGQILVEGRLDVLLGMQPAPDHQAEVALPHPSFW